MSTPHSPEGSTHPLVEFEGSVDLEPGRPALGLSLRGAAAPGSAARAAMDLLFSGVTQLSSTPPPRLHTVRVVELDSTTSGAARGSAIVGEARRFRIEAREGQYTLYARAVQLHGDPSVAFFAALPRTRVPLMRRWGWVLLLSLLRVRPLLRLIARRRP